MYLYRFHDKKIGYKGEKNATPTWLMSVDILITSKDKLYNKLPQHIKGHNTKVFMPFSINEYMNLKIK